MIASETSALLKGALRILVVDISDPARGLATAESFYGLGFEVWFFSNYAVKLPDTIRVAALPSPSDVVLLHDTDRDVLTGQGVQCRLVVRYTGAHTGAPCDEDPWIQRPITDRDPLRRDEAESIAEWAAEVLTGRGTSVLPPVLGGTIEEYSLEFLAALLPFGLAWGALGRDSSLRDAASKVADEDFQGFERSVVEGFKGLSSDDSGNVRNHAGVASVINTRLELRSADSAIRRDWRDAAEACGPHHRSTSHDRPPKTLEEALSAMVDSHCLEQWNRRLGVLRDMLL